MDPSPQAQTLDAVLHRAASISADVAAMRGAVDAQNLPVSDRQYLSRCFDLLELEIDAVRDYISGLR